MSQPQIQPGIYRHYKGNLYQVLGLVRHSETEEWLVLYKTLYGDFSSWVRPFAMFTGTVNTDNGEQPRFALQQPLEAGAAPAAAIRTGRLMTPAIVTAQKAGIVFQVHEYQHDPAAESYGEEAAAALGLDPACVFKTLLVSLSGHKSPVSGSRITRIAPVKPESHCQSAGCEKKPIWPTPKPRNAAAVMWWVASARWARKKPCPPLSTAAPKPCHK